MFITISSDLLCDSPYVARNVVPDINKEVCVPVSPFFINRVNRSRGSHSSETVKVCILIKLLIRV